MLTNVVDGFASTVSTVVTVLFNLFIGVVVSIYTLGSQIGRASCRERVY